MSWVAAPSVQIVPGVWSSAADAADEYFDWVARRVPAVRVVSSEHGVDMHLFGSREPAISLRRGPQGTDRAHFDVAGGWLVAPAAGGAFVFELHGNAVRIALSGFTPRLPRWIFVATHGAVHEVVMSAYQRRRRSPQLPANTSEGGVR